MIRDRKHTQDDAEGDLETLLRPCERALATIEDEEISEAEEQAVARSKEWFKHNDGIPFERVIADLGFTIEQIRNQSIAAPPPGNKSNRPGI